MFKKFIKATCLLAGVMFVAACTDYAEDIRDINDRIGQLEGKTMASLTEQKEGLEAALKTLQGELGNQIAGNIADLQGQINDLNADLEKLEDKQKKDIEDLNAAIEDLNAAIAKKADQSALDALSDDLDKEIEALNKKIEDLQKKITKNATDIATLDGKIAGLTEQMTRAEAALKELQEDTIPAIQDQINNLKNELEETNGQLKEHLDDYKKLTEETIKEMQEAIKKVQDGLSNLDKELKEYYENVKKELEKQKQELEGKLQEGLDDVNGRVDDLEAELKGEIEELDGRITELDGKITELDGRITELDGRVERYYEELTDKFNNYVLQTVFDDYKKEMDTKLQVLQADLEGQIAGLQKALDDAKKELNDKLLSTEDKLKQAIASIDTKLTARINELQQGMIELRTLIYKNEQAIKKLETSLTNAINDITDIKKDGGLIDTKVAAAIEDLTTEFDEKIDEIKKDYAKLIKDLQDQLDALRIDVEDLLARMQSIVYVPDYNDGKITIDYAKIGEGIVEGRQTIRYKVTPAECAEPLATLARTQTAEEPVLSYLIEEVKIRTRAEELVPTFTVVYAEADEKGNGFLTLTVETRNLGDDFYNNEKSYSVALLVTDGNNNRTTEYANCVPGAAKEIVPEIYNSDDEIITGEEHAAHYEIEYVKTGIENGKVVLPDHYVAFHFDGETKPYSAEKLYADFGYTVVVEGPELSYACTDETYADVFENDETSTYVKTYLSKIEAEAIGNIENVKYIYTAAGTEIFAAADVEIIKELAAEIVFGTEEEPVVIYWNFLLDAWSDAGVEPVHRDMLPLAFAEGQVFPEGAEWADICSGVGVVGTPVMKSNGKEITDDSGLYWNYKADAEGAPAITIKNFEWDKTYTLENTVEYPTYTIKVTMYVKTVDRVREKFDVIYAPTEWDYTREMEIAEGEISDPLSAVYDAFKELNASKNPYVLYDYEAEADMKVEDFLSTVFAHEGDTEYEVKEVKVNDHVSKVVDHEKWITRMVISKDSDAVSCRYSYKSKWFPEDEPKLTYTKDVAFWFFGDDEFVHLEKEIDFKLPEYDYVHRSYRVHRTATDAYCAHALGRYTAENGEISLYATDVKEFDIEQLDLIEVFDVILGQGEDAQYFINREELEAEGLECEFFFTDATIEELKKEVNAGISMEDNVIVYNGWAEHLYLGANLYLVDTDENGNVLNRVKLPTSFDKGGVYNTFEVKKFNPIGDLQVESYTVNIIDAKLYEIPVLPLFSLSDNRGESFAGEKYPTYPLINEDGWVVGDGLNGYAEGVKVWELYDLQAQFGEVKKQIPPQYRGVIDFVVADDGLSATLTFDNYNNIDLTEEIPITIDFTITHTWGQTTAKLRVIFTK